ncbi:MAG: DUF1772 domain-containing protein, partial [Brachybacterium sp.]|nr:DUF1772 domain-containing protein [Brachybacterium sp.]
VLLTAAIVLSVRVLVPINREILRWEEHGAPSTWRHPLRRWDRLHAVRVLLLAAAAFSLGLTALLL